MSERLHRDHALAGFLQQARVVKKQRERVLLCVQPDYDHVNLRGSPNDAQFREAAEAALQGPLPVTPNTWRGGAQIVYWLGPDEWLVSARPESKVAQRLRSALRGMTASLNVLNGGLLQLNLRGNAGRDLLAKGCTIDLHAAAFAPGQCAQTGLAKSAALIALMDDTPSFNLIVRRSFAEYIALWLQHAGAEFGIEFDVGR